MLASENTKSHYCIYSTFPMLESHTYLTFLHCAFSNVWLQQFIWQAWPSSWKKKSKSPKTQLEYQNCHQPLLLNHQCNKTYYWDDNHEFGYGSDGSNDSAKNWRHNEAVKCKCSLHTRLANDSSPQPKKPRNSWRQQEYPDDCTLNLLRAGKIKIHEKWTKMLLIGYSLSAVHLWLNSKDSYCGHWAR